MRVLSYGLRLEALLLQEEELLLQDLRPTMEAAQWLSTWSASTASPTSSLGGSNTKDSISARTAVRSGGNTNTMKELTKGRASCALFLQKVRNYTYWMTSAEKAKMIERAIKLAYDSLDSHLRYTYVKSSEGQLFHKKCVVEYAEIISILSHLYGVSPMREIKKRSKK